MKRGVRKLFRPLRHRPRSNRLACGLNRDFAAWLSRPSRRTCR